MTTCYHDDTERERGRGDRETGGEGRGTTYSGEPEPYNGQPGYVAESAENQHLNLIKSEQILVTLMCVCLCVCMRACMRACACVCVYHTLKE